MSCQGNEAGVKCLQPSSQTMLTLWTYREQTLTGPAAQSLVWCGDDLVDWVSGGTRYHADGTVSSRRVLYSYAFDAATADSQGEFAVIYTRLGTKALLLRRGKILRELNRSFYHADAYEYPVVLVRRGGRALLIHCPDEYNQLEIEDAQSGERLTTRESKSADFFHSRLAASPGGRYLLSAGWVWHPWDAVAYYDLDEALRNPSHLDALELGMSTSRNTSLTEEASACWAGEGSVILSGGTEPEDAETAAEYGANRLRPRGVALYDVQAGEVRASCVLAEPAGTMMAVGTTHVMAFYQHPRLIRIADGTVEFALPWLASGVQLSSIVHHQPAPPAMAFDPERGRFAVAQGDKIHVVTLVPPPEAMPG